MKINSDTVFVRKYHLKKCWSLYKKRKEKKRRKSVRKIPLKDYNLQNCLPSLIFNNICQMTNKKKKVTSTLR